MPALRRLHRPHPLGAAVFFGCLVIGLLSGASWPAGAGTSKRPPAGPVITISAPHPQRLELALDEVELHYPAVKPPATGAPAASAVEVSGAQLDVADGRRAIFALAGVSDLTSLRERVTTLAAANPAGQPALVAYVPGLPKSSATLRLITHEVGLVLDPGQDIAAVVAGLTVEAPRAVPGAPFGFVIGTADPFTALELAEVLRQRPGVATAYPIVRRLMFGR